MSVMVRTTVATLLATLSANALAENGGDTASLEQRIQALEQANRAAAQRGNLFNPSMSLILQGGYLRSGREAGHIPGFVDAAGGHAHGSTAEGLSLGESEVVMTANADDRFAGRLTLALEPEAVANVEEAYIDSRGLPAGVAVRAGRFYSELGALNVKHPHAWDFADAPLVYDTMLGTRYRDDGVQLRWVAPTAMFLELGTELMRGGSFPGHGNHGNGTGAVTAFAGLGGDVGSSHSWKLGLSQLRADAHERGELDPKFDGRSRLNVVDMTWKWAPDGNYKVTNLVLQAEYFQRHEDGEYSTLGLYDAKQSGYYAQAVYQFMPRWRVGVRHDLLKAQDPGASFAHTDLDPHGHTPKRLTGMVDFSNSEYSRIRLQYNRDDAAEARNIQWRLQYIVSFGAHGAHRF